MFTIQDYIDSLNRDKESLVANLTTKGVTCSDSETFTTLVPKVLDITSVNNQSKNTTITSNTTTTITPDQGYTGLSSVEVTTNVALDLSNYFVDTYTSGGVLKIIKRIAPLTLNTNTLYQFFRNMSELVELPTMDTSNVTNMEQICYGCSKLTSIPQYNTSRVTAFWGAFYGCTNLTTVPILNTLSATNMSDMFGDVNNLTDTSLDNILQMCANINPNYGRTKTLANIGITNTTYYPASRIQALPHYQDFLNAGWTIGY